MTYTFDELPDNSRIWIFQSNRKLMNEEIDLIQVMVDKFVVEWSAHGKDLHAGAKIMYNYFLILAVNEKVNDASGCSIDASVRFIKEIEIALNIEFLDRSNVAYLEGDEVKLLERAKVKEKIDNRTISPDTLIFNNLVQLKGALKDQWLIPARESWMKKYLIINAKSS